VVRRKCPCNNPGKGIDLIAQGVRKVSFWTMFEFCLDYPALAPESRTTLVHFGISPRKYAANSADVPPRGSRCLPRVPGQRSLARFSGAAGMPVMRGMEMQKRKKWARGGRDAKMPRQ